MHVSDPRIQSLLCGLQLKQTERGVGCNCLFIGGKGKGLDPNTEITKTRDLNHLA